MSNGYCKEMWSRRLSGQHECTKYNRKRTARKERAEGRKASKS